MRQTILSIKRKIGRNCFCSLAVQKQLNSQILERTIEKRKADDKTPEILEKETRQQQK